MKKKCLAMLLTVVMAVGLLPGTAFAAETANVSLSTQYTFAGFSDKTGYTEESYRAAPVVIDLDGDDRLEVINAASSLSVMDAATGAIKWQVNAGKDTSTAYAGVKGNVSEEAKVFCDPKVLDIDKDGSKEIVIGYGNGMVSVLDKDGKFKPGWPKYPTTSSIRALAVDDLNGDGYMEIIVGAATDNFAAESVWVYDCKGNLASNWPQLDALHDGTNYNLSDTEYLSTTAYMAGIFSNGIATGDLDGDGLPEIIVTPDNPYLPVFNYDGSLVKASDDFSDEHGGRMWGKIALWEDYDVERAHKNEGFGLKEDLDGTRANTYQGTFTHSTAVYTDVDGDGTSEIVVTALMMELTPENTSGHNKVTLADMRYTTVMILNQDRTRYKNEALGYDWTVLPNETNSQIRTHIKPDDKASIGGDLFTVPVCEDLDGDGKQEILFNSFDGMVHCFSLDKSEWSYKLPQSTDTVYEYATPVVCKDLDGDNKKEVIFASWTDSMNGNNTGVKGALYVLSSEGKLLASMDLPDAYDVSLASAHTNGVMAAPAVADVDGDGKYEVFLNTRYYALCAYEIDMNASTASATTNFTDTAPWCADAVQWAVKEGITTGVGGSLFAPGRTCSHAEILTFLWRAAGYRAPASYQVSANIPAGQYYTTAAYWAAGLDMIDASFNPTAPCTRTDVAIYIWKAFGKNGSGTRLFDDVLPNVLGWDSDAWKAINWVASNGIATGTTEGANTYSPNWTCTRGEIVTFLHRAYVEEVRVK